MKKTEGNPHNNPEKYALDISTQITVCIYLTFSKERKVGVFYKPCQKKHHNWEFLHQKHRNRNKQEKKGEKSIYFNFIEIRKCPPTHTLGKHHRTSKTQQKKETNREKFRRNWKPFKNNNRSLNIILSEISSQFDNSCSKTQDAHAGAERKAKATKAFTSTPFTNKKKNKKC